METNEKVFERYDLNRKVDSFIKLYGNELKTSGLFTPDDEYYFPLALRDFIEAKAVYEELRFPSVNLIGLWMPPGIGKDNSNSVYDLNYYANVVADEMKKTSEMMQTFPWPSFENSNRGKFSRLSFFDYEINENVLYRIIERGGAREGPRRGILFAKEFGLDVDIPMSYAINWEDNFLYRLLDSVYNDLDMSTMCPINYFKRNPQKTIHEISLETVFKIFEAPEKFKKLSAPKNN